MSSTRLPNPKTTRALLRLCKVLWPSATNHVEKDYRYLGLGNGYPNPSIAVLSPYDVPLRNTHAAGIINEEGQLLVHTIRASYNQVKEAAEADLLFEPGEWEKIKAIGAKIVYVDILYQLYKN